MLGKATTRLGQSHQSIRDDANLALAGEVIPLYLAFNDQDFVIL